MWQDKISLEKTGQNNTFRYSIFRLFFVHLSHLYIFIIHLKIITYAIYTQKIFWI